MTPWVASVRIRIPRTPWAKWFQDFPKWPPNLKSDIFSQWLCSVLVAKTRTAVPKQSADHLGIIQGQQTFSDILWHHLFNILLWSTYSFWNRDSCNAVIYYLSNETAVILTWGKTHVKGRQKLRHPAAVQLLIITIQRRLGTSGAWSW